MVSPPFRFKKFEIRQEGVAHPLGTDAVLLGAWAPVEGARYALDIGTGTGILALMMAQRNPEIRIDAIEIHQESAACAARNVTRSPWADRICIKQTALQDFHGASYDLIISNPPFFSETIVSPDEHRQRARTAITLKPGELLEHTLRMLSRDGIFCTILPVMEGRRIQELGVTIGMYCNALVEVQTRPDKPAERLLLQFSRNPRLYKRTQLTLMDQNGRRSMEFSRLTKDFYTDQE